MRAFFERRFGRDLGEVRLHSGPQSAMRNEQLNAYTFTYGSHIWLGEGQSAAPDYLLAHEIAHVIQQRQPRTLTGRGGAAATATSEARVQRLGGSVPFWVPLGRTGRMTGDELHEEVLGLAQGANADLDIEANAPNADLCGLWHRAPRAHGRVPLDAEPRRARHVFRYDLAEELSAYVGRAGIAAGRFRPYADSTGKRVEGIAEAPTGVEIGELKPAAKPMIESGADQLKAYICGVRDAARLTNIWAGQAGVKNHLESDGRAAAAGRVQRGAERTAASGGRGRAGGGAAGGSTRGRARGRGCAVPFRSWAVSASSRSMGVRACGCTTRDRITSRNC